MDRGQMVWFLGNLCGNTAGMVPGHALLWILGPPLPAAAISDCDSIVIVESIETAMGGTCSAAQHNYHNILLKIRPFAVIPTFASDS